MFANRTCRPETTISWCPITVTFILSMDAWSSNKWLRLHYVTKYQGPVSISNKTSYRKILRSLEAARLVFRIVRSLLNLTDTSATLLPRCLSNFKTIWRFKLTISRLLDFMRSYNKMSYRILKHGPGYSGPDNGSWVTCSIVIRPNPITYNLAMRVTYACWVVR